MVSIKQLLLPEIERLSDANPDPRSSAYQKFIEEMRITFKDPTLLSKYYVGTNSHHNQSQH